MLAHATTRSSRIQSLEADGVDTQTPSSDTRRVGLNPVGRIVLQVLAADPPDLLVDIHWVTVGEEPPPLVEHGQVGPGRGLDVSPLLVPVYLA